MTTNEQTAAIFHPEVTMHHATRGKALKLATTLVAEYGRLVLLPIVDNGSAVGFRVVFDLDGDEEQEVYTGEKVPSLAVVLDTCAEEGLDPTPIEEEEEPRVSGSVVPAKYRDEYRLASTTGRSNGDWLAEQLAIDTLDGKGNFVMDDFVAVLERNAVPLTGKWAALRFGGGRGWQGRFRMNGRQVLEKLVCKAQTYVDAAGTSHKPSDEWLADMAAKHGKWLAKEVKREAAATEAVKSTVEG
jgi:hypothetical protein